MIELIHFVAEELGHPIIQEDAESILDDFLSGDNRELSD